ncbi:ABC transporter substrate-binding protein [Zavarzinia compransoris]|uniref:Branched-chain amino acid ABC transporter substrate-binding protein n=1 Tax=Zavarzinia compransoris TaxID=1264899 RepID=A0A317EA93_9PROT|nr:ABC transporter substrate-binding protein [Zavarzinia compransoris]PWR22223.1 branched-chain amino acid ABC transporter substrate-binding protein [Zavarzinia compransoris]TDP47022.1 ABC transporter substrate binding protein (PQQ-dependent alcohol dehydrogenase system) [Zavarzinia compransoris]
MRVIAVLLALLLAAPAAAAPLTLDIIHVTRDEEAPIPFSFMEPVPAGEGIEGARLGLADNNASGRFTGQAYGLGEIVIPRDGALAAVPELAALLAAGPRVVVADLGRADLESLLALPGTADDIIVNARATDDALRREGCRANLFHTAVSRAMRADGLAQYLVLMGWKRWFLVVGPASADQNFAAAIRRSATRFGARIALEKPWTYEVGHRRTDSGVTNAREEIRPLTKVDDYDVLVVADEADDFGEYLPYRTALPRPVAGTHGLVPLGWSRANEQWGATQLQRRFEKQAKRFMTARDYANWLAVRALGEAMTKAGSAEPAALRAALLSPEFGVAGFKGAPLSFRPWDRQMRQPVLLATTRSLVAVAPEDGFLHRVTPLDTLGDDEPESACPARG